MKRFILSHKRKRSESSGGAGPLIPDLVTLGILKKPVSEYTNEDIGTTVLIPYNDPTGKILLNDGCIEFEVVGVNHHKDKNNADTPTITLMTKNIIRNAVFDASEPHYQYGSNRWKYSNIRQWLNSSGAANKWFTKQHDYDNPPDEANITYNEDAAYADAPGFLAGFSFAVLQHFTDITNITALHKEYNGGSSGSSDETVDKVFLPSLTEIGRRK